MNFVDLIIVVCSLSHPGAACQERHLPFESAGSLMSCMWQAQPFLANWVGEHPDARIASFRCAWPDTEEHPI